MSADVNRPDNVSLNYKTLKALRSKEEIVPEMHIKRKNQSEWQTVNEEKG